MELNFVHAKIKTQIKIIKYIILNKWCVWQAPHGRLRVNKLVSISNVCLKIASRHSRDHRCKRESPNDRSLWWILFENSRRLFPLIVNQYNNWSMDYVINICTLKYAVDVSRRMRALAYTVMNEWSISVVIQQSRWSKRGL